MSVNYYYPITLKTPNSKKIISEYQVDIPLAVGTDFMIAKELLRRMISAGDKGYKIDDDCLVLSRRGWTNIYYYNNIIMMHDYEPFYNPKIGYTYTINYRYNGLRVWGYCSA